MSPPASRRWQPPTVESLAIATFALFGMGIGSGRISDNSMLVHLRTGIDMAAGHGIPRTDIYSYTAAGHEWVVQSWLASFTYGWLERIGGMGWVAAEQGVLAAVLAWLILKLARTGSVARTIAAGGIAVGASAPFWSARPLLFGLIAFALVVLVVERRANPWWLVPIAWVWVNSHGSFPLGGVWLVAMVAGVALDRRQLPRRELTYLGAFVVGLVGAAINPLGPRLLLFPLSAGEKREAFRAIVEWQSPDFQSRGGLLALAFLTLGLLVLLRKRAEWRDALPVALFAALGLFATRNLAVLGIVAAPALRKALTDPRVEELSRKSINSAIAAVMAVVFLALGVTAASGSGLDLSPYPVAATNWLEDNGYRAPDRRLAHQDFVGCYFDLRYGKDARIFIDDRVDMYPVEVSKDYQELLKGSPSALGVLDRYEVDAILWQDGKALVAILQASPSWHRVYHRTGWSVFVRSTAARA